MHYIFQSNGLFQDVHEEHQQNINIDMPLYPHSILKKPSEFPPVPFNLDEEIEDLEDIIAAGECVDDGERDGDDDNESLDIILPNRDLNDFSDFDQPVDFDRPKPGQYFKKIQKKYLATHSSEIRGWRST